MGEYKDIIIGVSSCLLGHNVRYNGANKYESVVAEQICENFQCLPLCPEYAIGLGVPRDPIHLIQRGESPAAVAIDKPDSEVTAPLQAYASFVCATMEQISGYIFKARSPSCGLKDVPVFDQQGKRIRLAGGVYSARIGDLKPGLPMIDEQQLQDEEKRRDFLERVIAYPRSLQAG